MLERRIMVDLTTILVREAQQCAANFATKVPRAKLRHCTYDGFSRQMACKSSSIEYSCGRSAKSACSRGNGISLHPCPHDPRCKLASCGLWILGLESWQMWRP
jgi:hypothetical protein